MKNIVSLLFSMLLKQIVKIVAIAPILFASFAYSQSYGLYQTCQLQTVMGQAISGASVYFLTQPANTITFTPLAAVYSSTTGTSVTNPVKTNNFGMCSAYLSPGLYTVCYVSSYTGKNCYKDQQVTTNTGTYLPLSGGTLTGALNGTSTSMSGNITSGGKFLAAEGTATAGGYSFTADGSQDTGMFSSGDGILNFYENGVLALQFDASAAPIFTGLTGYVYCNGSSACTSSTTIPAASVSGLSGSYLPLSGGTLTGQLTMNNNEIYFLTAGGNITWGTLPAGSKIYDSGNLHLYTDDFTWFDSESTGTSATWNWTEGATATASGTTIMSLNGSGALTVSGTLATGPITESGLASNTFVNTTSTNLSDVASFMTPNLATDGFISYLRHGVNESSLNAASETFYYGGNGSTSNYAGFGLVGNENKLIVFGTGDITTGCADAGYGFEACGTALISGMLTASGGITGNLTGNATSATTATNIVMPDVGTTSTALVYATIGGNDYFRIEVGATAENAGWAEIATADDGTEPIYVRQYSSSFSTGTIARTLTLLDASGNTTIPGSLSVTGGITTTSIVASAVATLSSGTVSGTLSVDGVLSAPGGFTASDAVINGLVTAAEGTYGSSGYSFVGDGLYNTGMFSSRDDSIQFYVGGVIVESIPSLGAVVSFPTGINPSTITAQVHQFSATDTNTSAYTASQVVASTHVPFATTISTSSTNLGIICQGNAYLKTAATASTTFILEAAGVQFGTIAFGAGGSTGTMSVTSTSFSSQNLFSVVAPSTADSTAAGLSFSLCSTY